MNIILSSSYSLSQLLVVEVQNQEMAGDLNFSALNFFKICIQINM